MLEFVVVLILMLFIGGIIVIANIADHKRSTRIGLIVIGVLLLINVFVLLSGVVTLISAYTADPGNTDTPSEAAAWAGFVVSVLVSALASALLLRPVRDLLTILFPDFQPQKFTSEPEEQDTSPTTNDDIAVPQPNSSGEPLFPQMLNYYTTDSAPEYEYNFDSSVDEFAPYKFITGTACSYRVRGFNPASYVHMLAVVLAVIVLGTQFVQFITSGGLESLAETYKDQGIDLLSLLSNSIPFVVLSFLGVGLGVRRNWRQTFERLGLEPLTIKGFLVSIGLTFVLLVGLIIVGLIWSNLVPEDVYEEQNQASNALSESVSSVGLAFAIAASAAIGEELAFRGALQPVLGLWPTAIIFALMHPQYTLTPAALIIFGVALTFGWVRQRFSTTVAILTHFWYNLIQLLTLFLIPEDTAESLLRLF